MIAGGSEADIGELRITSGDVIRVVWRYLDRGSRDSDEREILGMVRHHLGILSGRLEGKAATFVLRVHRVPSENGGKGPPGISFSQQNAENSLQREVPLADLLTEGLQRLRPY